MNIRKSIAGIANDRGDMMIAWLIDNWYKVFGGVYTLYDSMIYGLALTIVCIIHWMLLQW